MSSGKVQNRITPTTGKPYSSFGKHHRVLAAPFQPPSSSSPLSSFSQLTEESNILDNIDGTGSGTTSRESSDGEILTSSSSEDKDPTNFRNFKFKPLESIFSLKLATYIGPTPESNWVIPGVLLVGAYPASQDDAETLELLTSILQLGITKFVCLQLEYRAHVTENDWRQGSALRPYFDDVKTIVASKEKYFSEPLIKNGKVVSSERLKFAHCPIVDCGVTDDDRVLSLCRELVKDITEGEVIYLHCWGGHGRTGTVVCIMLHIMYGLSAMECMRRCQAVHDLRRCPVDVGSPQTKTQRDQVTRIINRLIAQSAPAAITSKTAVGIGGIAKALTPSRSKLALSAHHSRNNSNGSMTSIGSAGSRTGPTSNTSSSTSSSTRLVKSSSKPQQFSPSSSSTALHASASAQASPGKPRLPPSSTSSSSPSPSLFGLQTLASQAAVLSLPGLLAISTAATAKPSSQHPNPHPEPQPSPVFESPGSSPMVHKKIRSDSVLEGSFAVGTLIAPVSVDCNSMEMMAVDDGQATEDIQVVVIESAVEPHGSSSSSSSSGADTGTALASSAVSVESVLVANIIHTIDVGGEQLQQQVVVDQGVGRQPPDENLNLNVNLHVNLSKSNSSGSCEGVKEEFSGLHLAGDFAMEVTEADMGPRSLSKEDTVSPAAAVSASPAKPLQSNSFKGNSAKPPLQQQQQQQSTRRFIVKRGNSSQPVAASTNKAMVPVPPTGLIPSSKTSLHSLFSRKEDN